MIFISIGYFMLRLINLTLLPIFNDEAIYLYWGQEEVHSVKMLFFSLYDAKPPFLMWLFGLSSKIFSDPLFAGRIVSVLCGFATMLGIYFIGKTIFNKQTAKLAIVLYILNPLFSFFDRLALMESAIAAIGVWMLYFLIELVRAKKNQYIVRILLGILLALGIWIKINVLIFAIPILVICIYKIFQNWITHQFIDRKSILSLLIIVIVSQILLLPLYLQSLFWQTLSTNSRFSLTFSELLHFPLSHWIVNTKNFIKILFWQLTPGIFFAMIFGSIYLIKAKVRSKLIFIVWLMVPIIILLLTGRNLTPRYLTSFMTLFLLPTAYVMINVWKKNKILGGSFYLIAIGIQLFITGFQLFSPLSYFNLLGKYTEFSQKQEYVTDWTSGYGILETITYLNKQADKQPIIVGVRIDAGNPESAMHAYYFQSNRVKTIFVDTKSFTTSGINCVKFSQPIFFVARDGILNGMESSWEEKIRFYKPESKHFTSIYVPKINCQGKTIYFQ